MSIKYWKVKVLCEGYESVLDDPNKIQRAYITMIVEASNGCEAMTIAKEVAENGASLSMAVRWQSFEPIEAASMSLPYIFPTDQYT